MKKYIDYILIYLIYAFSVVPYFTSNKLLLVYITVILLIIVMIVKPKRNVVVSSFKNIIVLITIMQIGQIFTLNLKSFDFESIFGTYVRFTFPYLILILVGTSFIKKSINLTYILAIIALVIWTLENVYPGLGQWIRQISKNYSLDPSNENILIYNVEGQRDLLGLIKNSGFAYEGGAYSIIILISLVFNFIETKSLKNKETLVFIISMLSTFSTAAYFTLFIFFVSVILFNSSDRIIIFAPTMTILVILSLFLFNNLSFLNEKVFDQIDTARTDRYATSGRFASAQADILEWSRNPLFGLGKSESTRFKNFKTDKEMHRVNGLADFLAKFGLIFFVVFYYLVYKSIRNYIKSSGIRNVFFVNFIFILIVLMVFAQIANQWPVYIMYLYLATVTISDRRDFNFTKPKTIYN